MGMPEIRAQKVTNNINFILNQLDSLKMGVTKDIKNNPIIRTIDIKIPIP